MSAKDGPDHGVRLIKRVRMACLNCRRKKVRCSGERPSCSFCEKLLQECQYQYTDYDGPDRSDGGHMQGRNRNTSKNTELASRVALLESKLVELTGATPRMLASESTEANTNDKRVNTIISGVPPRSFVSNANSFFDGQALSRSPWRQIPPQSVLMAAYDVFVLHCHCQPYVFFHENKFKRQLKDGVLPEYLLFAFLASAMRFSTDPYYDGKQTEALEGYARTSWDIIVSCGFVVDEEFDIWVVQAISLLAIIDSAAGRRRAAWVKIGLAVRISQDLGLMIEPDDNTSLSEQEERRRVFWSVYMLDRFVSCSKQRPRSILDEDCQLRLPCRDQKLKDGKKQDTLLNTISSTILPTSRPDNFALVILMCSVLGRCARYALDDHRTNNQLVPWDASSEYTFICSRLTHVESLSEIGSMPFKAAVELEFMSQGVIDQQRVGHFIFQEILFHLSHCLLHHPFLLRQRVAVLAARAPASWLSHAWKSCLNHAQALSSLLREAKELKCIISTSFYGYCALIAGGIHVIFLNSDQEAIQNASAYHLTFTIRYLEDVSRYWGNTRLITSRLKRFWQNSSRYRELLSTTPRIRPYEAQDLEVLWSVVDYGIMSNPKNEAFSALSVTTWPNTVQDANESPSLSNTSYQSKTRRDYNTASGNQPVRLNMIESMNQIEDHSPDLISIIDVAHFETAYSPYTALFESLMSERRDLSGGLGSFDKTL